MHQSCPTQGTAQQGICSRFPTTVLQPCKAPSMGNSACDRSPPPLCKSATARPQAWPGDQEPPTRAFSLAGFIGLAPSLYLEGRDRHPYLLTNSCLVSAIYSTCPSTASASSGLEKPLKILQSNHEPHTVCPQRSRDAALGSPFQRPTTPSAKKYFLRASLNLFWRNLRPLPV